MPPRTTPPSNSRGSILVLTLILTSLLLFLGSYLLIFSFSDRVLSQSHARGLQTYYLGEAGLNHAIFRIKNNAAYTTAFETNPSWNQTFTIVNPFGITGSYAVTITNTALARADISTNASITMNDSETKRVVETKVFRAIGSTNPLGETAGYADGNIDISASVVNFHAGSAHSNNTFTVNVGSNVDVQTKLNAAGNLNISGFSDVTVNSLPSSDPNVEIYAANYPNGPAEVINMPAIDFNSPDPQSYKSQATIVYSQEEFENLLKAAATTLTLPGPITYVEGDVILQGDRNLAITGVLVAERDIIIGKRLCWEGYCGNSNVNITAITDEPNGLLAKRKIKFDLFTGDVDINGLAYATDQITVASFANSFTVTGGLVARKLTITSVWQPIDIYRDDAIAGPAFNYTSFSPVISIEHWEEEY